jgi:hypothetical protein
MIHCVVLAIGYVVWGLWKIVKYYDTALKRFASNFIKQKNQ